MQLNARVALAAIISLGITLVAAPKLCADPIVSLHIELGSWTGSSFAPDGSDWNTFSNGNWAVVATAPGFGNPTLDGFNNVDLPGDQYWLFMADNGDPATAMRITLGYTSGSAVEVYTDPSGPQFGGSYTLVSGSGFSASLISAPQSSFELAPASQLTINGLYASDGSLNWVLDLNQSPVPEPASGIDIALGALALTALVFGRRRIQVHRA